MKALLLSVLLLVPNVGLGQYYGSDYYGNGTRTVRKLGEGRKSCRELFAAVKNPVVEGREKLAALPVSTSKTVEAFQAKYKDAHIHWDGNSAANNSEIDFLRFVRFDDYAKARSIKHGVEVYGVDNYIAWTKADEYLKTIPKGKLELTPELFTKVNEISGSNLHPRLRFLDRFVPTGYLPTKSGVAKRRGSYGEYPLTNPLNEEEYNALMNNPWLGGFHELPPPLSKPGARRGWIKYSSAEDAPRLVNELIQWYNANKEKMDPVELAARFQHAFVSIHPHMDGNGRTSRLLMDRILAEHGLPPSLIRDTNQDILLPIEKYVQEVRTGLDRFVAVAQRNYGDRSVLRNDNDDGLHIVDQLTSSAAPLQEVAKFSAGNKRFELSFLDGMIYDATGIPHVYRDGVLYPISDRSYRLLEMNVPIKREMVTKTNPGYHSNGHFFEGYTYVEEKVTAGVSPSQTAYSQDNLELVRTIKEKKVDLAGIKVHPYSEIDQANRNREIHLYPWQKNLLNDAVRIDADSPEKILMPFRMGKTTFDSNAAAQKQPNHILAQYEMVDKYYRDLEIVAKTQFPEALPQVRESRRKVHTAARTLLERSQRDLEALSPEARTLVEQSPSLKLFNAYLKHSKLGTASFDEASEKFDDRFITLMRSDSAAVNKIGFLSHTDFARAFNAMPGSVKAREFLERLNAFMQSADGRLRMHAMIRLIKKRAAKGESIYKYLPDSLLALIKELEVIYGNLEQLVRYAVETLLKNKYDMHSAGPEFERAFVMDKLHADGGGLKAAKSFTTNSQLMVGFPFREAVTSIADPQISIVRIPRKNAHIQFGSDAHGSEYEFLIDKPIMPWKILEKFSEADLAPPKLSDEAELYLQKYFNY